MWRVLGAEKVVAWLAEEGEVGKYSGLPGELKRLNGEVVLIENGSYICEIETGIVMTASQFRTVNYADRIHKQAKLDKKGNPTAIQDEIKVAEAWLAWEERRKVKNLVFKPGAPRELEGVYWNAWYDDMVEPVAPSVVDGGVEEAELERMLRMMKDQINNDVVYERLMSTLAWHVQNPGSPPMNYLVLMSTRGHTGKSLLLEGLYRPIFGRWSWSIDDDAWSSSFRPWIESQFVLYEEAFTAETKGAQRKEAARLTSMATAKELMLNGKHVPQRMIDKGFLLAVTTNNMDGLYVTKYDRRAFVVAYGQDPRGGDVERMKAETDWVSNKWMADGKGPARFLHVLLGWDCSGYDPNADALVTEAKQDMQQVVKRPIEQWVGDLSVRWEELAPRRYYTSGDLADIYLVDGDDGDAHRSKRALGMALTNEMKKQGYSGSGLLSIDGNKARYYDVSGASGNILSATILQYMTEHPELYIDKRKY